MCVLCSRPEVFSGKKVIVLGLGNTGGDIVDALTGSASSVFIAHNNGAVVVRMRAPPSFPRDIWEGMLEADTGLTCSYPGSSTASLRLGL